MDINLRPHDLAAVFAGVEVKAPVDSLLLKHLGGDLYAIWELTPIEQATLEGGCGHDLGYFRFMPNRGRLVAVTINVRLDVCDSA